jgi:hypothetical protein
MGAGAEEKARRGKRGGESANVEETNEKNLKQKKKSLKQKTYSRNLAKWH